MFNKDNFTSHGSIPDAGGYSGVNRNANLPLVPDNVIEFPTQQTEIEQEAEYSSLFQVVRRREFDIPDYEDDDPIETLFVAACCIGAALGKAEEDGLYTVLSLEDFNELVLI